jgi:site-specific DNA-methyltransferase (adenine-specific)
MINLMHGDCLELMKTIPDKSIDMVLTDPPYGTTACKWDVIIPFEPMWEQLKRITKNNGAICLFGSEPFSSHLRLSNLKMYKYDWIWIKDQSCQFMNAKLKPMSRHEIVSIFSTGKTSNGNIFNMKYFPQGLIEINKEVKTRKDKANSTINDHKWNRPCHVDRVIRTHTNYPYQDIKFKKEKGLHPTQKPVALLEYLIRTYTLENETILDFTMGSGSTGVACKNLNRNFIGIEKDDKYFDIAKKRIENA